MLTDAALQNIRVKSKSYKMTDRDGLYPLISPKGGIAFKYDYRFNGRRESVTLGTYGAWREGFARALRDRSIEAEATPRRTRGVTRKAERIPVRKMRERFAVGQGPLPEVLAVAYRAALTTRGGGAPWLEAIRTRELGIRRVLVVEAMRLSRSERPGDRALAAVVERFVWERPAPMTRDQALPQRGEAQRDAGRPRER